VIAFCRCCRCIAFQVIELFLDVFSRSVHGLRVERISWQTINAARVNRESGDTPARLVCEKPGQRLVAHRLSARFPLTPFCRFAKPRGGLRAGACRTRGVGRRSKDNSGLHKQGSVHTGARIASIIGHSDLASLPQRFGNQWNREPFDQRGGVLKQC